MQVKMLDNKKYGTVANEIKKNVDRDHSKKLEAKRDKLIQEMGVIK